MGMRNVRRLGIFVLATVALGLSLLGVVRAEGGGAGGGGKPAHGAVFSGKVTAIDLANSTITFSSPKGGSQTFTVDAETVIEVNGKAGALNEIQVGMYGGAKLDTGNTRTLMVRAKAGGEGGKQYTVFSGKVTAVDAANGSVTFTNPKSNESRTFTVAATTVIEVNGQPGTLAEIQVGMYGGAKLPAEGGAPAMVRAKSPNNNKGG